MVSVVTAAPTDGAPLLALRKPDKSFGATHDKGLNCSARLFTFDEADGPRRRRRQSGIDRLRASLLAEGAGLIMVSYSLPKTYKHTGALHVFRAGGFVASHGHKGASQETILTEAIGV